MFGRTFKEALAIAATHQVFHLARQGFCLCCIGQRAQSWQIAIGGADCKAMSIRGPARADVSMAKEAFIAGHELRNRFADVIAAPSGRIELRLCVKMRVR